MSKEARDPRSLLFRGFSGEELDPEWLHGEELFGKDSKVDLAFCAKCGAAVAKAAKDLHLKWHEELGR